MGHFSINGEGKQLEQLNLLGPLLSLGVRVALATAGLGGRATCFQGPEAIHKGCESSPELLKHMGIPAFLSFWAISPRKEHPEEWNTVQTLWVTSFRFSPWLSFRSSTNHTHLLFLQMQTARPKLAWPETLSDSFRV